MSKLIDDLFTLQQLVRGGEAASAEVRDRIEELRADIPEPIAAHFFRQMANGRKGVAYVHHGVCGACHLQLPHGLAHMLGHTNELMVCESCGAFLVLAPESCAVAAPATRRARRVVKELATAAA